MNLLKIAFFCAISTAAFATDNNVNLKHEDNTIKTKTAIWWGNVELDKKINENIDYVATQITVFANAHPYIMEALEKIKTDNQPQLNYIIESVNKLDPVTALALGAGITYVMPKDLTYYSLLCTATYHIQQLSEEHKEPFINIQIGSLNEKHALLAVGLAATLYQVFYKNDWLSFVTLPASGWVYFLNAEKNKKLAHAASFLTTMILVNSFFKMFHY